MGDILPSMAADKPFRVVQLQSLAWPVDLRISSARFRLFVAADVRRISTEELSNFAHSALASGMVYFCSWGPDCQRFHDVVDGVVVADDIEERRFVGRNRSDTIMTTWHEDEALEEALDFFAKFTCPTAGLGENSNFWLSICVRNVAWAAEIERHLENSILPVGEWPPN